MSIMNRKDDTKPRTSRGTPWFKQVGENLFQSEALSSGCYVKSGEIKKRPGLKLSEIGRSVAGKKVPKARSTHGKKIAKAGSAPGNMSRVHSGTDPVLVWRQLIKERQNTKMLQVYILKGLPWHKHKSQVHRQKPWALKRFKRLALAQTQITSP